MKNILFLFLSFFHPFYVSVTEINHNSKTKTIEVSTKIFFDDLELAIEKEQNVVFDITKPANKAKADELIATYLKKHLKINLNGNWRELNYLGYEIQGDAVWCYLEVPKVTQVREITVLNDVLYGPHKEQINLLNITVSGNRKSTKLDFPKNKAVFKF